MQISRFSVILSKGFRLRTLFLKKHKKHDFALETTTEIQKYCEICLEVQKSFVKRNQEVVFFCEKKGKFSYSAPKCEVQKL